MSRLDRVVNTCFGVAIVLLLLISLGAVALVGAGVVMAVMAVIL